MAKKKRGTVTEVDAVVSNADFVPESVSGIAHEPAPEPEGRKPDEIRQAPPKERLSFNLNEDGSIDLGSMRDATKEKLRTAAKKSPELFPSLPKDPPTRLPDQAAHAILNTIGLIQAAVAMNRGVPEEVARDIFLFNDRELAITTEPLQAVLAKHVHFLKGWDAEVTLLLVLVQIEFAKLHRLRVTMESRKPPVAAEPPVNGAAAATVS